MNFINYDQLANLVKTHGSRVGNTFEILNPQIFYTPGTLIQRRGINNRLAMLEALMFMGGIFNIDLIKQVAPNAKHNLYNWQSDYGPRTTLQLRKLIDELASNHDSRKAVMNFQSVMWSDPNSEYYKRDLACTTSMQFLIRNNTLNSITTMRSCDIVFGFPMDLFMFGMMTQYMALSLGIEKVNGCIQIGSLHMYDETQNLASEDGDPEFVQLLKPSAFDSNYEANVRSFYLKSLFVDAARDGALRGTWKDYKEICAWPFEFSQINSEMYLEIN